MIIIIYQNNDVFKGCNKIIKKSIFDKYLSGDQLYVEKYY